MLELEMYLQITPKQGTVSECLIMLVIEINSIFSFILKLYEMFLIEIVHFRVNYVDN